MIKELVNSSVWHGKLKLLRTSKGWNQKEAAEKCFTHQKSYWSWESGKVYPRLVNRKALAKAHGLKVEQIFSDHDEVVKNKKELR
jgi:DNA-binding XRE family transcriptional regulator